MPNFAEVASKKYEDIERPKLAPVGHFRWGITKVPEQTKSPDGRYEFVRFPVRALEAMDDVNAEELATYGDVKNIINRVDFIFDTTDQTAFDRTMWDLRKFLGEHVKCWNDGEAIAQALNASVNGQFIAPIVHKQDKNDKEVFHANLGKTQAVA